MRLSAFILSVKFCLSRMSRLKNACLSVALFLFPILSFAEPVRGLGSVANGLMEPVTVFSDFVHSGALVIGGAFIFAGIVKYFEHKRSPLMVPISTVIFLFVAGAILVALPLLSYVTSNGIPYSILKR